MMGTEVTTQLSQVFKLSPSRFGGFHVIGVVVPAVEQAQSMIALDDPVDPCSLAERMHVTHGFQLLETG